MHLGLVSKTIASCHLYSKTCKHIYACDAHVHYKHTARWVAIKASNFQLVNDMHSML